MNEILSHWLFQAGIIAAAASAILNGAPFLPWLRDIKPRRIQARLVGYAGLGTAFFLWCRLNPQQPAWPTAMEACAVIVASTLAVNVLIHWHRKDNPKDDDHKVVGRLPNIIILPMESAEEVLESLTQPRRDLTVALQAIVQAAIQAKKVARLAPDQLGAQVWCQKVGDPLDTAGRLVEESRTALEDTHQRVVAFWQIVDELRQMYRQGQLVFSRG